MRLVITTLPTTTVPGELLGTVSLAGASPPEFGAWIRSLVVLDDDLRPIELEDGIDYLMALARDLGRCSYLSVTLVVDVDPAAQ